MKRFFILFALTVLAIGTLSVFQYRLTRTQNEYIVATSSDPSNTPETRTLVTNAEFVCSSGYAIQVYFYDDPSLKTETLPNKPPTPTGSVDVLLNGGATTTLNQTLSGSGVRYANTDGSFVLWNKGDEVMVTRGGKVSDAYTNCFDKRSGYVGWVATTTDTLTFRYPPELPLKYVQLIEWPPAVERVEGDYSCDINRNSGEIAERTVNNTVYCISKKSEGAAGSTYTTYSYEREGTRLQFTILMPQCMNYDQMEQDTCLREQEAFDPNILADRILRSAL